MRQKSPNVLGKGPAEHRECYMAAGTREKQRCGGTELCPVGKSQSLTLSCNVGVALLVPIHETGIDVI